MEQQPQVVTILKLFKPDLYPNPDLWYTASVTFSTTIDESWASRNFDKLVKKYGGYYVGILGEKVIASGKTAAQVVAKSKLPNPSNLYLFKVPSKKDLVCLL